MSRTSRLAQLALVAAGAYAVTGALELAHDQPVVFSEPLDYMIEAAFVVALAATVVVLVAFARARLAGPAALVSWTLAAAGSAALATAALATTLARDEKTLDPLFALGFLAIVAGYVTLAAVDARSRLAPPRAGLVLLVGFIATAVVDNVVSGGGTLVLAATWAALGRLISAPDTATRPGAHAPVRA